MLLNFSCLVIRCCCHHVNNTICLHLKQCVRLTDVQFRFQLRYSRYKYYTLHQLTDWSWNADYSWFISLFHVILMHPKPRVMNCIDYLLLKGYSSRLIEDSMNTFLFDQYTLRLNSAEVYLLYLHNSISDRVFFSMFCNNSVEQHLIKFKIVSLRLQALQCRTVSFKFHMIENKLIMPLTNFFNFPEFEDMVVICVKFTFNNVKTLLQHLAAGRMPAFSQCTMGIWASSNWPTQRNLGIL